jgi:hypothetical protein
VPTPLGSVDTTFKRSEKELNWEIVVPKGSKAFLALPTSIPLHNIRIDNEKREIGRTPLFILTPGKHTIRVSE